ncbi:DNA gyrase inhibitor YacG [uncultured Sphingomonas sp.]|uniref:DNA gyrase inhibitor YacG n=1 Tax=uncultured Sphingomonas sp. TaxID=158754 RepID=UPI0025CD878F|nr:DNA gyrase inhibitor YacG [uncultured Sphingomonas sp.]
MTTPRCPICAAPPVPAHAPFCSRGCKDRDLLQWLGEGDRLPGETIDTESLDSRRDTD